MKKSRTFLYYDKDKKLFINNVRPEFSWKQYYLYKGFLLPVRYKLLDKNTDTFLDTDSNEQGIFIFKRKKTVHEIIFKVDGADKRIVQYASSFRYEPKRVSNECPCCDNCVHSCPEEKQKEEKYYCLDWTAENE